jgi:2-keto-4-pentenoate hydratase/2-oxohepta-3-ene-1,7-dioic acid hydratase in catechol pathway
VIGKTAKNVSAAEAMDYVLGYTAANDVSSRTSQFAQSQWCYSKSFDGDCPLGVYCLLSCIVPAIAGRFLVLFVRPRNITVADL